MAETNYSGLICKGSWALGSACGRCERCAETKPAWEAAGSPRPAPALKPMPTISPADAALLDIVELFDKAQVIGAIRMIPSVDLLAWTLRHMGALNAAAEARDKGRWHG